MDATQQGHQQVGIDTARADEAGSALERIRAAIDVSASQVGEIALSARDMARGAQTVNESMQSISTLIGRSMGGEAHQMAEAAERLRQLSARFKLVATEAAVQPMRRGTCVSPRSSELPQSRDNLWTGRRTRARDCGSFSRGKKGASRWQTKPTQVPKRSIGRCHEIT